MAFVDSGAAFFRLRICSTLKGLKMGGWSFFDGVTFISLSLPKFVHALSIRIQPVRSMHQNRCDQKYEAGDID